MAVDLSKAPHILVVHGVQTGSNEQISLDKTVRTLVDRVLAASHICEEYQVLQYLYEDKNDAHPTVQLGKQLATAIARGRPLTRRALSMTVDLIGDVVIAAGQGSTAATIRAGLRQRILDSHQQGHRVLLLAHSLGSFYALQVLNELIAEPGLFAGDDRRFWPVQGLITLGSPLGLALNIGPWQVFPKVQLNTLASEHERLPWHNFYSRHDPIVSGRVFGSKVEVEGTEGPVELRYRNGCDDKGWLLHGHYVNTGQRWLLAHTAYWQDPSLGLRLVAMLWG
ncbi:hypothetical protein [Alkalimonas sp.]|uniref:hypothetical protein n=1 Tax=Alkalimonas sp. TaxID=1872453 RepID=UPI00263AFCA5|nr:hypothetical protein [Alkalimonas sp.]MCC5825895.1 hypothetical protein [Alkalimonas sp.]